jgi:HEAT repeat protein
MSDIPKESPKTVLYQFVVFPLGIVLVAVAIFLLFGKLASDEQTIPDYLNEIRSGSSHERWQAAYQLSKSLKRGEAKRYPNLEQQVASLYVQSKHDDPRIRRYLGMVLGTLGDRRATPLLIDGVQHDNDVENRLFALMALGELRDPASLSAVTLATRDSEKDIRKAAYYALGGIGDRRAVDTLVSGLEDDVADVRWNAAISLSRFNDRRAIPTLREMLDRSRLANIKEMREDQKEDAMMVAMTPYARLAGAEARPDLERLTHDPSLRIQAAAKETLSTLH